MKLFDSYVGGKVISTRPRRYKGEVSRVGVFPYYMEGKLLWQLRPPDEVFDQRSIDSLLDSVMTVDHPDDDESLEVIHGSVYAIDPVEADRKIDAEFVLVTSESSKLADSGSPLSPMYDADLVEQPGIFEGMRYDLIQRNIRYTSVGLVDQARQGKSVKVFMQLSKDGLTTKTDTGIEYIASVITQPMKTNKRRIADSAAVLTTPVDAPSIELPDATIIPESVDTATLTAIAENAILEPILPGSESESDTSVEPEAETETEVTAVVEVVEETESSESGDGGEFTPIAQITTNGGVLVDREYVTEVVEVAMTAVAIGAMSLSDAIYYGQANIENVQLAVLKHAGIKLSESDDIGTAYRMFSQTRTAVETPVTDVKPALKTVAEIAKSKLVKPPVPQRIAVTHPATRKVADSAPAVASSTDDLISIDMLNI